MSEDSDESLSNEPFIRRGRGTPQKRALFRGVRTIGQ